MSSQSAGRQPPTNPPPGSLIPAQPTLPDQVEAARNSVLDILQVMPFLILLDLLLTPPQDTTWPQRSRNAAEGLAQIIDNNQTLKNIPLDETHMQMIHLNSLRHLLNILESARKNLQDASNKYGARPRRFRSKINYFFTYLDRDECTNILEGCRNEIEGALAALPVGGRTSFAHASINRTSSLQQDWNFNTVTGKGNHLLGRRGLTNGETLGNLPFQKRTGANAEQSTDLDTSTQANPLLIPGASSTELASQPAVPESNSSLPIAASKTPPAPVPAPNQQTTAPEVTRTGPPKRGKLLTAIKTTLNAFEAASGIIPVVGSYVGAAAKVGSMVVQMIQTMDSNDETAKELEDRATRLSEILNKTWDGSVQQQRGQMTECMNNMKRELQSLRDKLEELNSSSRLSKAFFSGNNAEAMKEQKEKIRTALEEMEVRGRRFSRAGALDEADGWREQRRLLDRLGEAKYGIRGHADEDVICLPNTRVQILKTIDAWIESRLPSENVLWIQGMAGRGKSTVASTVAHRWRYDSACAIFHFRRGEKMLDTGLVCGLARQLGGNNVVPELKTSILETVAKHEDVGHERLESQFQKLFVDGLSKLRNDSPPVLLIVDALDECEDVKYAVKFVELIERHVPSFPTNVKFLLTTRPETPLLDALDPVPGHAEKLDSTADVKEDVAEFFKHHFSKIRMRHKLGENWPKPENVQTLVDMSEGLFQWANTAIEHIMKGSPQHRIQELLDSPSVYKGLDALYRRILSEAFQNTEDSPSRQDIFIQVLGTIVSVQYPISLDTLAFMFADHPTLVNQSQTDAVRLLRSEALNDLRSLIHVPDSPTDPIHLMHTSVRDLLVDRGRCGGALYTVDLANNHRSLASKCLRLMERDLETNICKLSDISKANSDPSVQELVKLHVPEGLQYCCRSWAFHLTAGSKPLRSSGQGVASDIKVFSEKKLLGWLEVMSLIGKTQESLEVAKEMCLWLAVSEPILQYFQEWELEMTRLPQNLTENPESLVAKLWNDLCRFINGYGEPIDFGALHIYASALPACPTKTSIWEMYGSCGMTRVLNGPQGLTWSSSLWTKHLGKVVMAIAFAPDDGFIACGSIDGEIELLDAETGAPIAEPLRGHDGWAMSVTFSPDGKLLASGSEDKTIRLWNTKTGAPVAEPLRGHDGWVTSVTFSPDGKLLASGSEDKTIRLWDAKTGAPIGEPLRGHDGWVQSVAFSPDGKVLASGSCDKTIRLWDAKTGAPMGEPLRGHQQWVQSVAFSQDGKLLASGSNDNTIRLWDAKTGAPIGESLRGHDGQVQSVAFSPDGKLLASGSADKTIRLWNAKTGAPIGEPLRGHQQRVQSVAFYPDGKLLASGSEDKTIRLWDAKPGAPIGEPLRGHHDRVQSVAFSPDGKVLASGSCDKTMRLWDAKTGASIGEPLRGHDGWVQSAAFSPDGKLLASGSCDNTIRLWDARTGAPIGEPLRGHDSSVESVAFSPDGKLLASGSRDRTIRLWDAKTGAPLGEPLRGHHDWVHSVAFSPDGKLLASGSGGNANRWWDTSGPGDNTIRLWDAKTGAPIGEPLMGHDDSVRSVAFSPDGKLLASGSEDKTIRLWDAKTGALIGEPLRGHRDWVQSVAFSPDGKLLASGSGDHITRPGYGPEDNTIRLWDAKTGAPIGEPLRDHDGWVQSVAFSPDGKLLASGSWDRTIRLWDAKTGAPIGEPLRGHQEWVQSVAFSPDGKLIASGSCDKTIRLWDAKTGAPIGESLRGHDGQVESVAFSPDGKFLASGSGGNTNRHRARSGLKDNTIRLWDAKTGAPIGEPLRGHHDQVQSLAFSPDGKLLASGSHDRTIRLWDAKTGAPIGEPLTGHHDWVQSVAFSPDGKVLASGSGGNTNLHWAQFGPEDNTIRLWDAKTGAPIGEPLRGHHHWVQSVAFSPDGKLLASGSHDRTIRLWDAKTGAPIGEPLRGDPQQVHNIALFLHSGHPSQECSSSGSLSSPPIVAATESPQTLNIPTLKHSLPSCELLGNHNPCSGQTQLTLSVQGQWVMFLSKRLFWFPHKYWASSKPSILLSHGTLVINSGPDVFFSDVSPALNLPR
ncbi:hypothetical protein FRC01_006702 [Tulasnella sp. 417]|nr:hypothetical protein FRC01_006702 [Tulasnella sp. 417]